MHAVPGRVVIGEVLLPSAVRHPSHATGRAPSFQEVVRTWGYDELVLLVEASNFQVRDSGPVPTLRSGGGPPGIRWGGRKNLMRSPQITFFCSNMSCQSCQTLPEEQV